MLCLRQLPGLLFATQNISRFHYQQMRRIKGAASCNSETNLGLGRHIYLRLSGTNAYHKAGI